MRDNIESIFKESSYEQKTTIRLSEREKEILNPKEILEFKQEEKKEYDLNNLPEGMFKQKE